MGVHETRTLKSGNSEAVRLREGMGFGVGTELRVERRGLSLVLTPVHDPETERRKTKALLDGLAAIGRPNDGVQARPEFEAPEWIGI